MRQHGGASSVVKALFFVAAGTALLIAVFVVPSWRKQAVALSGSVRVEMVYDGDTFRISGGEKVRLVGIDTPEMHESNKLFRDAARSGQDIHAIRQMGRKAYDFVRPLIEGKNVRLEFDIEKRDKYGRLLAYAYLEDGTFLNRLIIERGYASPLTIPPNVKYADEFKRLFNSARAGHLGLWK